MSGPQRHWSAKCPSIPHGHGFMAAMSWKRAGKSAWRAAREMVMRPDSSGSRSTSSTRRSYSGSSSRKSTPWCASEISPGRGGEPPPTRAMGEGGWGGERKGGMPRRWGRKTRVARLCTGAASSASSSVMAGSMRGILVASMVLPVPGGPVKGSEWPPAAAISSALRACTCPRTSARSAYCRSKRAGVPEYSASSACPVRWAHTSSSERAGRILAPRARAASPATASGITNARPSRCAPKVIASAPRIGRNSPDNASSPANSSASRPLWGSCPVAARMPIAIGRSKRPLSFGRSAGARFTGTRPAGKSKRAVCNAARTRSRASFTSVSGRPTMWNCGSPPPTCASTLTSGASRPARPRLKTTATCMRHSSRDGTRSPSRNAAPGIQDFLEGASASSSPTRASSAASFSRARASTCVCTSYSSRVTSSRRAKAFASIPRKFFSRSFAGLAAASAASRAESSLKSRSFISIPRWAIRLTWRSEAAPDWCRPPEPCTRRVRRSDSTEKRNAETTAYPLACLLLFPRGSFVFLQKPKDTNMQNLPKVLLLAAAAGLAFPAGIARADDPPPSPFTGKVALYSEYEYRGISQTSEKPALQLNLDYAHASGLYIGTFLSNIQWLKDTAQAGGFSTKANIEWDIYGGYKWEFIKDWTLDVGYLRYEYPSSKEFNPKPNTDEVYAGVSYGPATLKYSYSFNNTFGVANSNGSDYLQLTVDQTIIA